MNDWPDSEAIDNTCRNGEVPDSENINMYGTLYRINPAGRYALYWYKGTWRESQHITNNMVRINRGLP